MLKMEWKCTHRHDPFERARLSPGLAPFETLKTIITPKMKDKETKELGNVTCESGQGSM